MDFSPEIAVFQSAFQLVHLKAGDSLTDLEKLHCDEYVEIISGVVDEICHGLQVDLEPEPASLWKQKLHALMLYALVKQKYQPPQQTERGKIPVYDPLCRHAMVLPAFSSHLFFTVMKKCSWTKLFLQSLPFLDPAIASTLLHDAIKHCIQEPSTADDMEVIAMVTDTLLLNCLCVPDLELMTSALLTPLSKSQTFIKVIFPDSKEKVMGNESVGQVSVGVPSKGQPSSETKVQGHCKTALGHNIEFWRSCLEADFLGHTLLKYYEMKCSHLEKTGWNDADLGGARLLGKVALTLYLVCVARGDSRDHQGYDDVPKKEVLHCVSGVYSERDNGVVGNDTFAGVKEGDQDKDTLPFSGDSRNIRDHQIDFGNSEGERRRRTSESLNFTADTGDWLLYNLYMSSDTQACLKITEESSSHFCINYSLVEQLCASISPEKLVQCLKQVMTLLEGELIEKEAGMNSLLPDEIEVLPGIKINSVVLMRMVQEALAGMDIVVKVTKVVKAAAADLECSVIRIGSSWNEDLTLEALLWRVDQRVSHFEVCLDMLLSDSAVEKFWNNDKVYSVLCRQLSLLAHPGHVLNLIRKVGQSNRVITLGQLVMEAYAELSPSDKDHVAMVTYREALDGGLLKETVCSHGDRSQLTTFFNKVTTEGYSQDIEELMLLDPAPVLMTAVEMGTRNANQALSMSKVLHQMSSLCQCRHPTFHSNSSLLLEVIQGHLQGNQMTDKEMNTFSIFVQHLLQLPSENTSKSIKVPVLSPLELLNLIILPCISASTLTSSDGPISIKFAMKLLSLSLDALCNKHFDWEGLEFEPMALVLILVEVLHECVPVWEVAAEGNDEIASAGPTKLVVKEMTLDCLNKLTYLMKSKSGQFCDDVSVQWLVSMVQGLHWVPRLYLSEILTHSGLLEDVEEQLRLEVDGQMTSRGDNLTCLLMYVGVSDSSLGHVASVLMSKDMYHTETELKTALVQVLPELLYTESARLLEYVETLIARDQVALVYRARSTSLLPVTQLADAGPLLCLSQILRDVMVTYTEVMTFNLERNCALLHHVLKTYVGIVKSFCDRDHTPLAVRWFSLGEMFHHAFDVARHLPEGAVDQALVMLMHVATKFKDVTMVINESSDDGGGRFRKMVKEIKCGMMEEINCLPDTFEEKHMLIKKLD